MYTLHVLCCTSSLMREDSQTCKKDTFVPPSEYKLINSILEAGINDGKFVIFYQNSFLGE